MTRLSVWRIESRALRAIAMWFSVVVCLPLYLAALLVWGFVWAVLAAIASLVLITPRDAVRHCRSALAQHRPGHALQGGDVVSARLITAAGAGFIVDAMLPQAGDWLATIGAITVTFGAMLAVLHCLKAIDE